MPKKITTYKDAFYDVLGIEITDDIRQLLTDMEAEGHTEHSICYSVWRRQNYLKPLVAEENFLFELKRMIEAYSYKRDDIRWHDYNRKRDEHTEAEQKAQYLSDKAKARRYTVDGYICLYQALSGGPVLIDYNINPAERLKILQSGSVDVMSLMAITTGTLEKYNALRQQFNSMGLSIKGNWYKPDSRIFAEINRLYDM